MTNSPDHPTFGPQKQDQTISDQPILTGQDRQIFLRSYFNHPRPPESDHLAFVEEFIDHPERFEPTNHTLIVLYAELLTRDTRRTVWPYQIEDQKGFQLDDTRIRNIKITVKTDSSTNPPSAVLVKAAEFLYSDGKWESFKVESIAFYLPDFVQKISSAS